MTEVQTQTTKTKRTVGLVIAAVVLIGGVVFGAVQLSGGMDSTAPSGGDVSQTNGDDVQHTGNVLPKAMGGQEAIDAMGDDIDVIAKKNGMTAEKLESLLLKDSSAFVSKTGMVGYKDAGTK